MARNRDNFSQNTISTLELRVGTLCSNPNCRAPTTGAHSDPNKVLRRGVAAHIKAASPGGPRYDLSMQQEERWDIANGIWLCQNCARMIDIDDGTFPVELLVQWKTEAENAVRQIIINGNHAAAQHPGPALPPPHIDVELVWTSGARFRRGVSEKNVFKMIDGHQVIDVGEPIIIHWELGWNYDLRLYNNSRREVFNLAVEFGDISFDEITTLEKFNNLPPLTSLPLSAKESDNFEGYSFEADAELRKDYPAHLEGMQLVVRYRDDMQQNYTQTFRLENGNFQPVP